MRRIDSPANALLKEIRELGKKAKKRREEGYFVGEGERLLRDLPLSSLVQIFLGEDYRGELPHGLSKEDERIILLSKRAMESISNTESQQGIVAKLKIPTEKKAEGDFFLLLEDIQDPGNLGTIFRTAEAAGVSHIFLSRNCTDLFSPKVLRSTMGSLFRVPFSIGNLLSTVEELRKKGVTFYAMHLAGREYFFESDFSSSSAFMLGNEGNGLSDELSRLADEKIRIPMMGSIESLNVATAGSIVMYEVYRQRAKGIEKLSSGRNC